MKLFIKTSQGTKSLEEVEEFTPISKGNKKCIAVLKDGTNVIVDSSIASIEKRLDSRGLLL